MKSQNQMSQYTLITTVLLIQYTICKILIRLLLLGLGGKVSVYPDYWHILFYILPLWLWLISKGNACLYSPDIPTGSMDFTLITTWYWNSFWYSLISLGRMQRIFCSCGHSHSINFSFHTVPIIAGWTEAVWIQSFAQGFYTWATLGSNALTTRPQAP